MTTLSRRHPCARPSFCRRPANAFLALVEEGLREYEDDRRAEEREKRERSRTRALREVYAFHLEMLNAVLAAPRMGWAYGPAAAAFGRALRVRPARGTARGRGTSPIPEA